MVKYLIHYFKCKNKTGNHPPSTIWQLLTSICALDTNLFLKIGTYYVNPYNNKYISKYVQTLGASN